MSLSSLSQTAIIINSKDPLLISNAAEKVPTHGNRNITPLPYDPTGLRTAKTATWTALDKVSSNINNFQTGNFFLSLIKTNEQTTKIGFEGNRARPPPQARLVGRNRPNQCGSPAKGASAGHRPPQQDSSAA